MTTKPEILAITTHAGYLYAVSKAGHLLPLYRYAPLGELSSEDAVPFAAKWPAYSRPAVMKYYPLPTMTAAQLPDDVEAHFGSQNRKKAGDKIRDWDQATYQRWPLYIFGDGTTPDPTIPAGDRSGELFQPVPTSIDPCPVGGGDGAAGGAAEGEPEPDDTDIIRNPDCWGP